MKILKSILTAAFAICTVSASAQLDVVRLTVEDGISDENLKANIEKSASTLLSSLNSTVIAGKSKIKMDKEAELLFTKDGRKCLDELWASSAMMCPVSQVIEKGIMLQGGTVQVRNIPVTILAADDDNCEQELVMCFNEQGQIDNLMIALEEHRYLDVINAQISVKDFHRRQAIVDFVENFRTAYNRKDIEYINNVFSDNALIITGKVVKIDKKKQDLTSQSLSGEQIQYQKSTKEEYINNLKRCFKNNSYINLIFDELEVMRHPKRDDIFGVTLKQHWNSSNYSDVGYLFLMINFEDEMNPAIQVRTWQPDKYNGKPLPREEVFSLDMFSI
ncbi:MAG: nuclear transport factor 2 family protein [Bacteroidetes bacterium]|nr:nuclear transport factor 2 family protein [Candidatus Colenecus caballi]